MSRAQAIALILLMNFLTVYGQMIIKWRVSKAGMIPVALTQKLLFLAGLFTSPWVLSGIFAAFLASLCWMAAISRLDLSFAYPFTGLTFVLVMVLSSFFFKESLTWPRLLGSFFVVVGIIVSSRG